MLFISRFVPATLDSSSSFFPLSRRQRLECLPVVLSVGSEIVCICQFHLTFQHVSFLQAGVSLPEMAYHGIVTSATGEYQKVNLTP